MRLSRTNLVPVLMMAATLCLPSPTSAQVSLQDVQVSDIETMKEKVVGLAQEFDESQYDWRPVEGAPSVRTLFAKILGGCQVFPTYWGNHAGPGVTELQLILLLPRAEMINELNTACDRLISVVREMDNTERMARSGHSGRPMQVDANILIEIAEMHEHLGQLIAYARINDVVPPWSL